MITRVDGGIIDLESGTGAGSRRKVTVDERSKEKISIVNKENNIKIISIKEKKIYK